MQKPLKIFCITIFVCMFLIGLYNYKKDTYAVFDNKFSSLYRTNSLPNIAFLKQKHFLKLSMDYENFILGSANAMNIPTYNLPWQKVYSFADFYQTLFDNLKILELIIDVKKHENNSCAKNVLLLIEPEYLYIDEEISNKLKSQYGNLPVPENVKENLLFYIKYLFKNPFKKEQKKWSFSQKINFFTDGSFVNENETETNFKYFNAFDSKLINFKENKIKENIQVLKEITNLCKTNNINLFIILTPQYIEKLKTFNAADIKNFKENLSKITDFYDFWTDSDFCSDKNNFYDKRVISAQTGEKIVERLFYENQLGNFGILVKKEEDKNEK